MRMPPPVEPVQESVCPCGRGAEADPRQIDNDHGVD